MVDVSNLFNVIKIFKYLSKRFRYFWVRMIHPLIIVYYFEWSQSVIMYMNYY